MIPAKYWSPTKKLMLLGAMAGGKAVEDTATGNPLTFLTDLAKPLKSLLIPFTPIQEGSGDPSPENVRPITGWTGVNVSYSGKNVLQGVVKNLKNLSGNNGVFTNTATDTKSNAQIRIEAYNGNTYMGQFLSKSVTSPQVISTVLNTTNYPTMNRLMITHYGSSKDFEALFEWVLPKGKYTLQFNLTGADVHTVGGFSFDSVMVEAGEVTPSQYEAPNITETDIPFPSPVYGGTLDAMTGVLTVEWDRVKISDLEWQYQTQWGGRFRALLNGKEGQESVSANMLCPIYKASDNTAADDIICGYGRGRNGLVYIKDGRFTDKADFVEAVGDEYIYYPLATPQEIQLTPSQITTLVGNNTLWNDANGDMTAVYFKKA